MFPGRAKDAEGLGMNESREDYIKTIYALKSRMKIVRSVDIANEMGYTRPSVSRATTTLREKGLITMDGKTGINLTKKGLEVARRIYEKHELLKNFLLQTTGTDERVAEEEACRMEHFVSQATLEGIRDFIQKNQQDAKT